MSNKFARTLLKITLVVLLLIVVALVGVVIWRINPSIDDKAMEATIDAVDYQYNFCSAYCKAIGNPAGCFDACNKTPAAYHQGTPTATTKEPQ